MPPGAGDIKRCGFLFQVSTEFITQWWCLPCSSVLEFYIIAISSGISIYFKKFMANPKLVVCFWLVCERVRGLTIIITDTLTIS